MSNSIQIYINEVRCQVDPKKNLPQILEVWGATKPYALMINGRFLPNGEHETYQVQDDDQVEVVSAIAGG